MLGRAAFTFAISIATLAACTLTTDLDGFALGASDASPPNDGPASDGKTGPDSGPARDGGDAGTVTPVCEVPTDADPLNCGACGKSCLGGACMAGKCRPATISDIFNHPLGIGISNGKIYVGDQNTLVQLDLDGQNAKVVVPGVEVHYVFGTDKDVFFTDGKTSAVRRWSNSDTGPSVSVVSGIDNLEGVAVSPTDVYFARYIDPASGGGVYRAPLGGGNPTLAKAWDYPEGVNWADGKIYIGSDGTDTAVQIADDGSPSILVEGGGPTGVFVVGDDAFVTRQGAGEVLRVSISTKAVETLATRQKGPSGIVALGNAVYWVEVNSGKLDVLVR